MFRAWEEWLREQRQTLGLELSVKAGPNMNGDLEILSSPTSVTEGSILMETTMPFTTWLALSFQ